MITERTAHLARVLKRPWVGGAVVFFILAFGPGLIQLTQLAWQRHRLAARIRTLQATHQQLVDEHQRLTSDPTYVEGLIRSTFKMAKPGELVVPLESKESAQRPR